MMLKGKFGSKSASGGSISAVTLAPKVQLNVCVTTLSIHISIRFALSFVSPRDELMSSGRLFVRPTIAWVSWLISSEEAAVLSLSCREACAGTALRSSGSESLSIWSSSPSSSISSARRSSSDHPRSGHR